jgi:hypothetical protein
MLYYDLSLSPDCKCNKGKNYYYYSFIPYFITKIVGLACNRVSVSFVDLKITIIKWIIANKTKNKMIELPY